MNSSRFNVDAVIHCKINYEPYFVGRSVRSSVQRSNRSRYSYQNKFDRAVILLFLCVFFFTVGCGREDPQLTTAPSEKVNQEIHFFTAQNTKAGVQTWTLIADVALYLDSGQIHVENPEVTIFQDGRETMTIIGDTGEIEQNREDFKIMGNPVKGVSQDGILYTNELYWKDEKEKLSAPGEVQITRGDSVMFGKEMEADPKLEVVTLKKDVHFTIYPKDEKINATKD